MVFCYQILVLIYCEKKFFSDRKRLEAEGGEFSTFLKSLEKFTQTVKDQNKFWEQNAFSTFPCRFFRSNKLEQ